MSSLRNDLECWEINVAREGGEGRCKRDEEYNSRESVSKRCKCFPGRLDLRKLLPASIDMVNLFGLGLFKVFSLCALWRKERGR